MKLTQELWDEMEDVLLEDVGNADSLTRKGSIGYLTTLLNTAPGTELGEEHELLDVVEYFGLLPDQD